MEQWRDIKGFEGYQVSSFGRVRTHNKISHTNKHGDRHWKDRILKFKKENYSFKNKKQGIGNRVDLWKDGKSYTFLVHRLVATTFLENNINTNMTVNHKDGNRYNNRVDNLEWLTPQKAVKIKNEIIDEEKIFISMAEASRYFKKYDGFISYIVKKNKNKFTINGCTYLIEVMQ